MAALFAGAAAAAWIPFRARAAGTVEALGLTCIDYRLVDDAVRFFAGLGLTKQYDELALAGASLAAVSPKFPSANSAFWDQLAVAKELHHIRKVVVLDHRDCGAYKVAFGKDYAGEHDAETAQHKTVMTSLRTAMAQMHPDLEPEFYLMALDGKAERLL
jgi:carbonic anhydrase